MELTIPFPYSSISQLFLYFEGDIFGEMMKLNAISLARDAVNIAKGVFTKTIFCQINNQLVNTPIKVFHALKSA